jgi:hypothetical protein
MKVIWEEGDIYSGVRFGFKECSTRWRIGFLTERTDTKALWGIICEQDYFVYPGKTPAQVAEYLTENGYLPSELL